MLRLATIRDAAEIAHLHVAVWRDTYRHLAPPAAIDALTEAHRFGQWQAGLSMEEGNRITIVAELDGSIVGFIQLASPQEPLFGDRQEIKYLYVAQSHARQGIGRQLLKHLAKIALRGGVRSLGLGVVVGNEAAINFYQAMAARLIGRYQDPGPLWRSDNLLYAWDDLTALTEPVASGS
jgi:ribosomal protein S18 acetylase RimI-like enzyme